MRRTNPPSHISLDGLAVTTHRSAPSSPLVKSGRDGEASTFLAEGASSPLVVEVDGMERRHLSWQRGSQV